MMMGFGFYTFLMIEGDYERELEALRRHADTLREAERESGASDDGS